MRSRISNPKDFWAGLVYVGFGAAALWIGQGYRIGTAGRMGPGYFPLVLASILVAIGLVSLVRSVTTKGVAITDIVWKPMALILAANVLFALVLPRAGVVVALLALCIVSAAASREFRFDWKATAGLIALVMFCVIVFVQGLGVPMPLYGTWLEPWLKPLLDPILTALAEIIGRLMAPLAAAFRALRAFVVG